MYILANEEYMFVFDGHSDLLTDITSRRINDEKNVFQTRHFPKLVKGGVKAVIAVVWIDPPYARNLKDNQIKAIANSGGIIGVNSWAEFVDKKKPNLNKLVDHIDYLVNLAGIYHVAFGFDFTDFLTDTTVSSFKTGDTVITSGINGADEIPNIIRALHIYDALIITFSYN